MRGEASVSSRPSAQLRTWRRDPYRVIYRLRPAEVPNVESSPKRCLWLWVPAFAGTTAECGTLSIVPPHEAGDPLRQFVRGRYTADLSWMVISWQTNWQA